MPTKKLSIPKEQADYLQQHHAQFTYEQLSAQLGITFYQLRHRLRLLGLKKNKEQKRVIYKRTPQAFKADEEGKVTTRRIKGKLKRFIRMGAGEWIPLSHYVWKQAGRELPPSSIIHFRDGNMLNDELDNLVLMSKAEWITFCRAKGGIDPSIKGVTRIVTPEEKEQRQKEKEQRLQQRREQSQRTAKERKAKYQRTYYEKKRTQRAAIIQALQEARPVDEALLQKLEAEKGKTKTYKRNLWRKKQEQKKAAKLQKQVQQLVEKQAAKIKRDEERAQRRAEAKVQREREKEQRKREEAAKKDDKIKNMDKAWQSQAAKNRERQYGKKYPTKEIDMSKHRYERIDRKTWRLVPIEGANIAV